MLWRCWSFGVNTKRFIGYCMPGYVLLSDIGGRVSTVSLVMCALPPYRWLPLEKENANIYIISKIHENVNTFSLARSGYRSVVELNKKKCIFKSTFKRYNLYFTRYASPRETRRD